MEEFFKQQPVCLGVAVPESSQTQTENWFQRLPKIPGSLLGSFKLTWDRLVYKFTGQSYGEKMNLSGLHSWVARKKPLLKKQHKKARLKFAKAHLNKTFDFWKKVLWTDEAKI